MGKVLVTLYVVISLHPSEEDPPVEDGGTDPHLAPFEPTKCSIGLWRHRVGTIHTAAAHSTKYCPAPGGNPPCPKFLRMGSSWSVQCTICSALCSGSSPHTQTQWHITVTGNPSTTIKTSSTL